MNIDEHWTLILLKKATIVFNPVGKQGFLINFLKTFGFDH